MTSPLKSRPILTVLRWQAFATLAIAAAAGLWAGFHAALSAALGGLVTLSSTVVYAFVLGMGLNSRQTASADASIVTMLRAEGAKILVVILQLWLVLATYKDVVLAALFAAFAITVLLFSTALLAREH